MRKKIKQYLLPGATFALNLLAALFWVALRVNYSGISKFLGADTNPSFLVMNLPVMVCVLAWIACAGALAGAYEKLGRWWNIELAERTDIAATSEPVELSSTDTAEVPYVLPVGIAYPILGFQVSESSDE